MDRRPAEDVGGGAEEDREHRREGGYECVRLETN